MVLNADIRKGGLIKCGHLRTEGGGKKRDLFLQTTFMDDPIGDSEHPCLTPLPIDTVIRTTIQVVYSIALALHCQGSTHKVTCRLHLRAVMVVPRPISSRQ